MKKPINAKSLIPEGGIKEPVVLNVEERFLNQYKISIDECSDLVKKIHERMNNYEQMMAPNVPILDKTKGAENQEYLLRTFLWALDAPNKDIHQAVDVILHHIAYRRHDIYSDRMVYRFTEMLSFTPDENLATLKILELFLLISNPATRVTYAQSEEIKRILIAMPPAYTSQAAGIVTYLEAYTR